MFLNLLYLAAALGDPTLPRLTPPPDIAVVTAHMQGVTGDDLLYPGKALLLGPVRTIPREYPHLTCRAIDITPPGTEDRPSPAFITTLCAELLSPSGDPVVAYRGIHRLIPTYDALGEVGSSPVPPRLRTGGVYWITGGLGGIGLEIAQYLATAHRARLILTGRGPFPPRHRWDLWLDDHAGIPGDALSEKIRRLKGLEQKGAEILVYSADVGDKKQMETVLHDAVPRFGPVRGIIHSAGIIQGGLMAQTTPGHMESAFKSKVDGIRVLDDIIAQHPGSFQLDFMLLCSSLNALAGVMGEVTYTAANAFLDAYALYKTAGDRIPTISVNWDAWQGVGFALEVQKQLDAQFKNRGDAAKTMFKHGMLPGEGISVFKRILSIDACRVLVSTMDINARFSAMDIFKEIRHLQDRGVRHPRPDLGIPYAPPASPTEQKLCETWEQFLGMEKVGIHDNFFELGVSSLGIIQAAGIINETLSTEIPALTLYGYPTVHELAQYIDGGETVAFPTGETQPAGPPEAGKNKLKQRKNRMGGGDRE